jgi:hypothetical protein
LSILRKPILIVARISSLVEEEAGRIKGRNVGGGRSRKQVPVEQTISINNFHASIDRFAFDSMYLRLVYRAGVKDYSLILINI